MILKLSNNIKNPVILKDQFFDLRGLSAYTSLSVGTLRTHIKHDGLPVYALGGKLLVRKSEFDGWIAKFRMNRSQDVKALVDEVMAEIGALGRRSKTATT